MFKEIIVNTKYGNIRGKFGENPAAVEFLGIPFAKPPVGELRFCPPEEPEEWKGVLDCTHYTPACIQSRRAEHTFPISEDCLYLNIYAPTELPDDKLPVFFWIYGGGFQTGQGLDPELNGEALAAKGAVVVVINYRCNVFGFFSTKELEERIGSAYNLGLLDQVMALKWVHDNISTFGGDPERVMVHGQSAGGISTRMQLVSPLTEGLFSRAVVHSGGGLNEADPVRSKEEFQDICQKCLDKLGWTLDEILVHDAEDVTRSMTAAAREILGPKELAFFQPFADGYTLFEEPGKSISEGRYHDIPIMCGTVAGDSWMFTRKVREQLHDVGFFKGFAIAPSQSWAKNQVENGRTPIYTYYMDRTQPQKNQGYYTHGLPPFGASTGHCAEISYVFGTLPCRNLPYEEYDYKMSEIMMDYWFNFAKNGDPNGEGLPVWSRYEKDNPVTMHFGDDVIASENVVTSPEEQWAIDYTQRHPGMLNELLEELPEKKD